MAVVARYLSHGLRLVVPLAIACTVYLYLYPIFGGCAFPAPSGDTSEAFEATKSLHWPYTSFDRNASLLDNRAPFRMLTLGDPQLEGDTSILTNTLGYFPKVRSIYRRVIFKKKHAHLRDRIRMILHDIIDVFFEDIPHILESFRKRFDLWGNDFYLAHIYRTMHWWTQPTHVTILGDLVGSQWIEDDEFERRGDRFWNRTFKGGERLSDDLAQYPGKEYNISGLLDGSVEQQVWAHRLLNVVGNHDVGYAGDLDEEKMDRFERVFGKANYELRFELPVTDPELNATIVDDEKNPNSQRLPPEIRIIVVNDMNLDTPARSQALQDATYSFINAAIGASHAVEYKGGFTILLTHIPTYKPEGICVDGPMFEFHPSNEGGGIKEQYLLSEDASKGFWEGIFGMSGNTGATGGGLGRPGLILNGHDHEGCDTWHYVNQTNGTSVADRPWEVARWEDAQKQQLSQLDGVPGRREITVRSMMGDFGGNAGLLSMWFDHETWEWKYEYADCKLGRQHFWWLTHLLDFGVLLSVLVYGLVVALEAGGIDVDKHFFKATAFVRKQIDDLRARRTKSASEKKPALTKGQDEKKA